VWFARWKANSQNGPRPTSRSAAYAQLLKTLCLESTVRAAAYQKAWFAQLREDVFERQKPYAIVQADMPLELFHAMDVPVVSNQWWAAMVAAKRLAPYYLDGLNAMGYHEGLCRYCSLSLASTLRPSIAGDPAQAAPWGGLPKPALLAARLTCDCIQRVFEIWAAKLGAPFVPLDAPGASELPPRWWELSRYRWSELFESHRLDFMVAQFHSLIGTLERITGSTFDLERLRALMEGVNQQEHISKKCAR
jgi:benzoyl-CoA reductase subunit B